MDSDKPEHTLLSNKNYNEAASGLTTPSDMLLNAVKQMESKYRVTLEHVIHQGGVTGRLQQCLLKCVLDEGISCPQNVCHVSLAVCRLFTTLRLHHSLREANRHTQSCNRRRNRKVMKFSHC